jgi:hypothetical protein
VPDCDHTGVIDKLLVEIALVQVWLERRLHFFRQNLGPVNLCAPRVFLYYIQTLNSSGLVLVKEHPQQIFGLGTKNT